MIWPLNLFRKWRYSELKEYTFYLIVVYGWTDKVIQEYSELQNYFYRDFSRHSWYYTLCLYFLILLQEFTRNVRSSIISIKGQRNDIHIGYLCTTIKTKSMLIELLFYDWNWNYYSVYFLLVYTKSRIRRGAKNSSRVEGV